MAQAMGTGSAEKAVTQASAAVPESQLSPGAVIKPGLVAPVPRNRPKTFKQQGPVDILAGT